MAGASVTGTFAPSTDPRGDTYTFTLDTPIAMELGTQYYLRLQTDSGLLSITGAAVANETDYDYGLPFRIDSYDAFGGIYRGDLNLQVYWDDNTDKLNRFVDTLNQTDYIFIPTNHQYAQITRLPERYPLTTYYYRELMGCPLDQEIIPCYHEAKPGDHEGRGELPDEPAGPKTAPPDEDDGPKTGSDGPITKGELAVGPNTAPPLEDEPEDG